MVEEGEALFDGREREPKDRIAAGVQVDLSVVAPIELAPEEVAFGVLYEDADIAIVDKPAGVVVHPGAGVSEGTLAAGLLHRWPQIRGVGDPDRWGIVHRLDKETSGALAVAKTEYAFGFLKELIAGRRLGRVYRALVEGEMQIPTGTIEAPIGRDPRRPSRFRVTPDGRPATTHYRRLAGWSGLTLIEVTLETGRTHQIRVHMSSIGHPLVGDGVYGASGVDGAGAQRVWLHSHLLEVPGIATARAPLPEDLVVSLASLGPPREGELPAD